MPTSLPIENVSSPMSTLLRWQWDLDRHSQVRAYLGAVEAELAHRGQYLGGEQADSWDIHVWGMVWMIHSALPDLVRRVVGYPGVMAGYERMVSLGTGERSDADIEFAGSA